MKRIISLFFIIFLYSTSVLAGKFFLKNITNNNAIEQNYAIDQGRIIWEAYNSSTWATELFLYDQGKTNFISQNNYDSCLSGNEIMWRNWNDDIYLYNIKTKTCHQISKNKDDPAEPYTGNSSFPYLRDSEAVWSAYTCLWSAESGYNEIWYYNSSTGIPSCVSDLDDVYDCSYPPKTDKGIIVWSAWDRSPNSYNQDIFLYKKWDTPKYFFSAFFTMGR